MRLEQIRRLAALGLSQSEIGKQVGLTQGPVQVLMAKAGIRKERKPPKPAVRPYFVQSLPTANALRSVSIFRLGVQ